MVTVHRTRWLPLLASCLCCVPAGASTLDLYGAGARSISLAGTHEAIARDYLATWSNPARLSLGRGVHFGFGTQLVFNHFAIDRERGEATWPTALPSDVYVGHLGVSAVLGGVFRHRVGLGIHMQIPLGAATTIQSRDYRIPQVPIYESLTDRLVLAMGVGIRVTDWLSAGASFQLLASLVGTADFSLSVLDRRFNKRSLDIDLFSRISPILGLSVHPGDTFRFALVWRRKNMVRYALPLQVTIEQVGLLRFTVQGVGLWSPDQLVAAGSWQLDARWLLTAAATWARWSALPPLAPKVDLVIDDSELDPQATEDFIVVRNEPVPMGASDIIEPRVGVEWQALEWLTGRLGLRYRPTALPRADGIASYLDAPAWTVGAGVGLTLRDDRDPKRPPLVVDVGLGFTHLVRRTVQRRDPAHPVGSTSLSGGNVRLAVTLHHDF